MISSCCLVNSLFYPSFSAYKFSIHFWLKWPLTARIIQKAVSRTLKQSDIVLYAGGDAGVSIFEDGEAFIQICEKGGDVEWGNALRRKLNGLAQNFWGSPTFPKASAPAVLNTISRRMPPCVRSVFNLTPQTFCGTCGTGISARYSFSKFGIIMKYELSGYHYELWAKKYWCIECSCFTKAPP